MAYFVFLGALSALKDIEKINDIEAISGSSAGSILGLVYILARGNTKVVLDHSLQVPVGTIMKPNIRTFLKSFGLVQTSKLKKTFQGTVHHFLGRQDVTFKELYDHYPVKLYVSACCINLSVTHYFSVDTSPDMSVIDAICMSIAVPLLIETMEYGPWRYIDGGTLEEIPCTPFIGQDEVAVICSGELTAVTEIKDIKTYIQNFLFSVMKLRHSYPQFQRFSFNLDANIFDFGVSEEAKLKLFLFGYQNLLSQIK